MARLQKDAKFAKRLGRLTGADQKRVLKALDQFKDNHLRPSLRFKKMRGYRDLYEISASQGGGALRVVMRRLTDEGGDLYLLMNVGTHDVLDRL